MNRISKENYYLNIAQTVLERATCLRRVYGAIIVKNDEIISTGYNGSPRGRKNCVDMGFCTREAMQVPRGERYELCRSVHAEANAIISASRRDMVGGTLYLVGRNAQTGEPLIINLDTTPGGLGDKARSDWLAKQFRALGVQFVVRPTDFNRFQDKIRQGNAQLFFFGWNW